MHYTYTKDLLSLFRSGRDTLEIANLTGLREHQIYNQIHEMREQERQRIYQRDYQRRLREDWNSNEPY